MTEENRGIKPYGKTDEKAKMADKKIRKKCQNSEKMWTKKQ